MSNEQNSDKPAPIAWDTELKDPDGTVIMFPKGNPPEPAPLTLRRAVINALNGLWQTDRLTFEESFMRGKLANKVADASDATAFSTKELDRMVEVMGKAPTAGVVFQAIQMLDPKTGDDINWPSDKAKTVPQAPQRPGSGQR